MVQTRFAITTTNKVNFPLLIVKLRGAPMRISTKRLARDIGVSIGTIYNYVTTSRARRNTFAGTVPPHDIGNAIIQYAINSSMTDEVLLEANINVVHINTETMEVINNEKHY